MACFVSSSSDLLYLCLSYFPPIWLVGFVWFYLVLFWVMFRILCPDRNLNERETKALEPS